MASVFRLTQYFMPLRPLTIAWTCNALIGHMSNNNRNAPLAPRLARPLLWILLGTAFLAGILMLLAAITSFAEPYVSTMKLYEFSGWIRGACVGTLLIGMLAISFLKLASQGVVQIRKAGERVSHRAPVWFKAGMATCLLLLLLTAAQGFRNVHPDGTAWISTGHAGPWAVAEPAARTYLWLSIRASSLIGLGIVLLVTYATQPILAALSTTPQDAA
jgi:hypothetical protein